MPSLGSAIVVGLLLLACTDDRDPAAGSSSPSAEPPPASSRTSQRPLQTYLLDLDMFDAQRGVGLFGREDGGIGVFATEDGADTVQVRSEPGWERGHVAHVRFRDPAHGFAYGSELFSTSDGGVTWHPIATDAPVQALVAIPALTWMLTGGCVKANCTLLRVTTSDDDGRTWANESSPFDTLPAGTSSVQGALAVVDEVTAFVASSTTLDDDSVATDVSVTHDRGASWERRPTPCEPPFTARILAAPDRGRTVWLLCDEDPGLNHDTIRVYQSHDDGRTWQITALDDAGFDGLPATLHTACCAWDLATFDETTAWLAAGSNAVMVTRDGGKTWNQTLHARGDGLRVLFVDALTGFAIAGDAIYATVDGGMSWTPRATSTTL